MKSPRLRSWLLAAMVFVIAFDVAFLWQRASGAYRSEFGAHPDEAAHYVTGLMIRDYLAAGCPGSPMKFADDYYAHYPKIGLGVWPPFFYIVQSAWTLPFGVSRTSVLLLMCALAAFVAVLIYRALRDEYGHLTGVLGANLFLILPLVREYDSMIMAEMLCAALMFGATLAFGNFLDREKRSDAVWFGILAALAILTKGTGVALVIMVPLALLFSRKWHLLASPMLWASAAITAIVAGPWTWHFRNEGRLKGGWLQPNPSLSFTREALPFYAGKLAVSLGVFVGILTLIGLVATLLRRRVPGRVGILPAGSGILPEPLVVEGLSSPALPEATRSDEPRTFTDGHGQEERPPLSVTVRDCPWLNPDAASPETVSALDAPPQPSSPRGRWDAAAALIASVLIFQIIMPVGLEARHLISALPAAVLFAIAGFFAIARALARGERGSPRSRAWMIGTSVVPVLIVVVMAGLFDFQPKRWSGFAPVAEFVLADTAHPKSTVLISSDASGEGMFISELAMREKRPGHTVQRASKILASMAWSGAEYHARFTDDAQLAEFLGKSDIAWIVVDLSMPAAKRGAHHEMLQRVCEQHPERFHLAATSPAVRGGLTGFPPIRAYSVSHAN